MKLSIRTLSILASATAGVCSISGPAGAQGIDEAQLSETGPQQAGPPGIALPSDANPADPATCPDGAPLELSELVGEALGSLTLRPDQQTAVEQIGRDLDESEAPVERAKDDLLLSIADSLKAGAVDREATTPKISALVDARLHERPAVEQALAKLHGVLDSQQRSQFVDALEGAVQDAMTPASQQTPGLGLTEDQLRQLRALGARQRGTASEQPRILRLLEAFKGESFNPGAVALADAAANAQQRTGGMLDIIDGLTRILTPEQRTSLAVAIRSGVQCASGQAPPEGGALAGGDVGTTSPTARTTQEQRGFGGRRGGMGFGPGFGMGFGPGFGGAGRGFGMGFGPPFGGGFFPGQRGFFPGFQRGFFPGFHRPFFPRSPFAPAQFFSPFSAFSPFAAFSSSFSANVDFSAMIRAMTSSFAFF